MAMLERGLEVGEDVDRSIMSKEVRTPVMDVFKMSFLAATLSTLKSAKVNFLSFFQVRNTEDSSYRNLRDWYIYRDYMNGLEYVIHAFAHLKKHHQ